ncbi:phage tail protein [Teredinibacter turnerae]|uniref:phage tail protein n=1 Tax=Teredinibacter turnerae TaxID=2426 RepID=UPI00037B0B83|nr:phage tail protein [Teredinibacter turnerae]
MTTSTYPIPSFYFVVKFLDGLLYSDTSFQSVSGLGSSVKYETLYQGGMNEKAYMLPQKVEHTNLVLKRGIGSYQSGLYLWLTSIMHTDFALPVVPKALTIQLLDEKGMPSRVWGISDALPVKWSIDEFNSTKNEVAIETVELGYTKSIRLM